MEEDTSADEVRACVALDVRVVGSIFERPGREA